MNNDSNFNKPIGFEEICFDKDTNKIVIKHVDYVLTNREGKVFAEPINKSKGNIGIGGKTLLSDAWWPLEETPCDKCGIYGLVHTIHIGEYACANCSEKCIISPKTKLFIKPNSSL